MSHSDTDSYSYCEYDGTYYRLLRDPRTGDCLKAEGYFKGLGYMECDPYDVMRCGQGLSAAEFKRAITKIITANSRDFIT